MSKKRIVVLTLETAQAMQDLTTKDKSAVGGPEGAEQMTPVEPPKVVEKTASEPTPVVKKVPVVLPVTILVVEGIVRARIGEDPDWQVVKAGMKFDINVELWTGLRSLCHFWIAPDQRVTLDRLTTIKVIDARFDPRSGKAKTDLGMKYGRTRFDVRAESIVHDAKIHTPGNTLAVRGTKTFITNTLPFDTAVASYSGRVEFGRHDDRGGDGRGAREDETNAQASVATPASGVAGRYGAIAMTLNGAVSAVSVAGNLLDEVNDTFFVQLSDASNATIADPLGLGTIIDDEDAVVDQRRDTVVVLIKDLVTKDAILSLRGPGLEAPPLVVAENTGGPADTAKAQTLNTSVLLAQTPAEMGLDNDNQGGGLAPDSAGTDTGQFRDEDVGDQILNAVRSSGDMLLFDFSWQNDVDRDGFVKDPLGQAVCVLEDTKPGCVFSTAQGGRAGADHVGSDRTDVIRWQGNQIPTGLYEYGLKYFTGSAVAPFQVEVASRLAGGVPQIIDTFSGELDTVNQEANKVVDVQIPGP